MYLLIKLHSKYLIMDKKDTLDKKIGSYSALTAAFVAGASAVNSQIVYVDIDPDTVLVNDGQTFDLDIDGDTNVDFNFNVAKTTSSYSYVTTGGSYFFSYSFYSRTKSFSFSGASSMNFAQSSNMDPAALSAGNMVSATAGVNNGLIASSSFESSFYYSTFNGSVYGPTFTSNSNQGGNFAPNDDKFLGVRFNVGGNNHYGWIRLEVSSNYDSLIIKEYAYEQVSDSTIEVGDSLSFATGLEDISNQVEVRQGLDELVIFNNGNLQDGSIELISLDGKIVKSQQITQQRNTLPVDDLATGIYVADIRFKEGITRKKVYVR